MIDKMDLIISVESESSLGDLWLAGINSAVNSAVSLLDLEESIKTP